jgi:hypothetical protein
MSEIYDHLPYLLRIEPVYTKIRLHKWDVDPKLLINIWIILTIKEQKETMERT